MGQNGTSTYAHKACQQARQWQSKDKAEAKHIGSKAEVRKLHKLLNARQKLKQGQQVKQKA